MALDEKTLSELKSQLAIEKENLEKSLAKIARPIDKAGGDYETTFDEIGTDREDNATEVEQYSDNLSVETELEKRLQDILDAMARMENGTYGKCANCDKEINLERLKANPAARNCIECK